MPATIADIIKAMEALAPSCLAEEWDNVGLQVGQKNWPVQTVWIALDPAPDVVAAACSNGIDLLITHHPLIFNPLRSIDFSTPVGSIIHMAGEHQTGIFAAHTNLDNVIGGTNDALAYRIGLDNLKILSNDKRLDGNHGLGRVGELDKSKELASFALEIKEKLGLKFVKVAGKHNLLVNKVAVCAGSGSSLMDDFFSSGAQVYISGDLRYHDARATEAADFGLIDIGHFASEHLIVDVLVERLAEHLCKILLETGIDVKVEAYKLEKDPFTIL